MYQKAKERAEIMNRNFQKVFTEASEITVEKVATEMVLSNIIVQVHEIKKTDEEFEC